MPINDIKLTHEDINNATTLAKLRSIATSLLDELINQNSVTQDIANVVAEVNNLKDAHQRCEEANRGVQETNRKANATLAAEVGKLKKRVTYLEREATMHGQYTRRFHLELCTGEKSLKDSAELKTTVASLLSETGVAVESSHLDKCHLIGEKKKGRVIMELTNRSIRDDILRSRKNLKGVTVAGHGNIYINESMCPQYKTLDYICRELRSKNVIDSTWFFNGRLWVIEVPNGDKQPIVHIQNLYDLAGQQVINNILKK